MSVVAKCVLLWEGKEEVCGRGVLQPVFSVQLISVGSLAQTPRGDGSGSMYADFILLPVGLRANYAFHI